MDCLHHRILFPLFFTDMQTPPQTSTLENALSLQEGHIPGSMWIQLPSSRTLLYKVSALLKYEYCNAINSLHYFFFSLVHWVENIYIWSGSVGQANGKHVAHKSLQNLGIIVTSIKRHNCVCKQRHSRNSAVRNVNTQGF